jgi:hypothetical protein
MLSITCEEEPPVCRLRDSYRAALFASAIAITRLDISSGLELIECYEGWDI